METVNVRDEGAVRIIEMDRPEALNAFSNQLMDELTDSFQAAAADSGIKVVVLTGAGRAFSVVNGASQSWKRSKLSSARPSEIDIIFAISAGVLSAMMSTSSEAWSSMRGSLCFLVGSGES